MTMRAVVLGLVGVLVASGAQAACPIGRTVYEVVDTGSRLYGTQVARPDLVGAKFSVLRHASDYREATEGFENPTRIAHQTLLVTGTKGRFVVERQYASHSSPAVTAVSWAADAPDKKTDWRQKDTEHQKRVFGVTPEIDVLDGPLSSLQMKPVACR